MMKLIPYFCVCFIACTPSFGQVDPEVFTLDNGMKFIVLPRSEEANSVAVGWVARVGSVNERPGITGISHFFEHLMFKGTDTIGTNDAAGDAAFTNQERTIRNLMLDIIWNQQYDRFKRGEIDDPWDAINDTPQLASLREALRTAMEDHRSVIVKDEFDAVYKGAGAVGMNAFTSEDVTFYINSLPANKFELWCWMESDRLANSVFREFFSERDVVHEERRMRTESSPTGEFQEQFNSMFWQASPYSWPVIGWPSDLNSYTLEEARRYYSVYYQPSNLVGVVVGDVNVDEAKTLITEYFGRLKAGESPAPPVPTIEPSQKAPMRMVAQVDSQSEVEVRYHGVPFNHKDGFALELLSGVLNGRTGRLFKSMVEGTEIASSASFRADARKYAGSLSFSGTVKGETDPIDIEDAWYAQVELLQSEHVSEYELEKVKNNIVADQVRQLKSNFFLMIQLGYMEAIGGWEFINDAKNRLLAVTSEDIKGVANKYLIESNSSVALYYRSEDAQPVDEELAGFSGEEQMMIKQTLEGLKDVPNEALPQVYEMMKSQSSQVPPEMMDAFEYLLGEIESRMDGKQEEVVDTTEEQTTEIEVEEEEAEEQPEEPQMLELTPNQQAQADTLLDSLIGKDLSELKMVYGALSAASMSVPEDEKPVLDYVLAKLGVYIAEQED